MATDKPETGQGQDGAAVQKAPARPVPDAAKVEKEAGLGAQDVSGATPGASGLSSHEERQLGELQERQAAARAAGTASETIHLKIKGPHESMTFGGVTITQEPTPVPLSAYGPLASAAADAGVELVQHDQEG